MQGETATVIASESKAEKVVLLLGSLARLPLATVVGNDGKLLLELLPAAAAAAWLLLLLLLLTAWSRYLLAIGYLPGPVVRTGYPPNGPACARRFSLLSPSALSQLLPPPLTHLLACGHRP